jgi:NADPH2:quinone reductase
MLHRSAHIESGDRALIHGASGGVGTALLQLGHLAELKMYGTCSTRGTAEVLKLGAAPIDYQQHDFVSEVLRVTGDGVDAVFDPIGGSHLWHSRKTLRRDGRVVGYGLITSIRGSGLTASRRGQRQRFRGTAVFAAYIAAAWLLPGHKRIVPYSIQTLKRVKPEWFREDLRTLLKLLQEQKIKPVIAQRLPLVEARQAHEMLAKGGVVGKIVLVTSSPRV